MEYSKEGTELELKSKFDFFRRGRFTYLDNAATTQVPDSVTEVVKSSLEFKGNPHRGAHEIAEKNEEKIDYAQKNKDPAVCAEIPLEAPRNNCYMTMAYYLRDPNLCENISQGYYKLFCEKWKDGDDYSINTTRTVWSSMIVNFDEPYEAVQFDYWFSSDAEGYALVLLDKELIGAIYESSEDKEHHTSSTRLSRKDFPLGEYLLSVIIIPLSEEKSEFSMENLIFYELEK